MFSAVAHKNLADARKYFDEHLAQNDYYAAGEIRPGQWIGVGAERLGLKDNVTREQFHALCENQNPNDGERLTQRSQKEGQRRVFYDFTCSAPKSVSVLAVTLDDQRLIEAHEEAARLAFRELETFAATRIRKQGVENRDRVTGNLVAAAFVHDSSRAPSVSLLIIPALIHCIAPDGADKLSWRMCKADPEAHYGEAWANAEQLVIERNAEHLRDPDLSRGVRDFIARLCRIDRNETILRFKVGLMVRFSFQPSDPC